MDKFAVKSIVVMLAATYVGVCAALIALALAMPYRVDLLPPVLVTGCAVAGTTFCIGMVKLWTQDAPPKPKAAQPQTIIIPQVSKDKRHQYIPPGCPATPEQIYAVASRVWAGAKMGHRDQSDILGDNYNKFRDWLLREGYLEPKGHKAKMDGDVDTSGVRMTPEGYEWFTNFYSGPPSPSAVVYAQDTDFTPTHTGTQEE